MAQDEGHGEAWREGVEVTRILSAEDDLPLGQDYVPQPWFAAALERLRSVSRTTWIKIGAGTGVAALIGLVTLLVFVFFLNTHPVRVTIESFSWERQIEVEQFRQVHEGDWYTYPSDAYDVIPSYRWHYSREVYDHTNYYECGTAQYPQTCSVPVYRSEAVYDWWFEYTVNRWRTSRWLVTTAKDHNPFWAPIPPELKNVSVLGQERVGNIKKEKYNGYTDKGYKLSFALVEFNDRAVGDTGTANVNRLNKIRSINWDKKP